MSQAVIWMLHGIEPDSPRTQASDLYANLTMPPDKIENLVAEARSRGWRFVGMRQMLQDLSDDSDVRDILITIDDGLRNVYTVGYPLFRRLQVPFTFFVATDLIESGFDHCRNAEMDGMAILADEVAARGGCFPKIFRRYRHFRRFLPFLSGHAVLRLMLGHSVDFDRYRRETICSPEELREMAESGLCEIGSHTDRHVHVDRVRNVERELVLSKQKIERWTGRSCEFFSYPYGHADERSRALVKKHFTAATKDYVGDPRVLSGTFDPWLLPRVICLRTSTVKTLLP